MDGFRIEHPIEIEDLGVPGNLPRSVGIHQGTALKQGIVSSSWREPELLGIINASGDLA